jgi:High potential iron-sulfur protein
MLLQSCENCAFWAREPNKAVGVCQRYPETYIKYTSDWCGEFQSAEQLGNPQEVGPFDTNQSEPPDQATGETSPG